MITGTTRGVGVAMGSPTETCIVSTGWMDRKDDEADEDAERPGSECERKVDLGRQTHH